MGPAEGVKETIHLPGPQVTEIGQSKATDEGDTACCLMAHRMLNAVLRYQGNKGG